MKRINKTTTLQIRLPQALKNVLSETIAYTDNTYAEVIRDLIENTFLCSDPDLHKAQYLAYDFTPHSLKNALIILLDSASALPTHRFEAGLQLLILIQEYISCCSPVSNSSLTAYNSYFKSNVVATAQNKNLSSEAVNKLQEIGAHYLSAKNFTDYKNVITDEIDAYCNYYDEIFHTSYIWRNPSMFLNCVTLNEHSRLQDMSRSVISVISKMVHELEK